MKNEKLTQREVELDLHYLLSDYIDLLKEKDFSKERIIDALLNEIDNLY